jgi:hypothetical protein
MRKRVASSSSVCFLAIIVLVLGLGTSARVDAQVVGGTLSGTVTDQAGGAVPNAVVAIADNATGEVHTVTTTSDGIYTAPNLTPGVYTVTLTATGFQKTVQSNVTMTVGGAQTLNLSMRVGQATETIQVTADAPTVNLSNAEIGGITTEAAIKDLPLNGRSWSDLANLTTGVYELHVQPNLSSRDRFTRGYGVQLSISGSRPQQNNYRVDGISINDPGNGGPGSVLGTNSGVDAIAEFSVLTTGYSTEYGRASGGIINATTKSGTNQFHGTGYEFLRNSWLDSKNYFDDPNSKIPEFRRNQFGASAGGPIIQNKTFIFGDYEGLRQGLGLTKITTLPSPALAANADAKVAPYLAALFPINGTLAGKTVCTITPTSDANVNNCTLLGATQVSSENYYIIRADHNISVNDTLSGTFFRDQSSTGTPDDYNNATVNTATSNTFVTIAETHTFSSTLVNSARFGFNRITQGGPAGATPNNPAAADTSFGVYPTLDSPQVAIAGANNLLFNGGVTSSTPQTNHWNSFQFYDDAFWTKGKHSLKIGGSVERDQLNVFKDSFPGGVFNYSSWQAFIYNCGAQNTIATGATVPCDNKTEGGLGFGGTGAASITTDIPGTLAPYGQRMSVFGLYFQDDYRLRPNLTINMGLRYEPMTVPNEVKGRVGTLATIYQPIPNSPQLPLCGQQFKDALGNVTCNALNGPLFKNNTLLDFSPRIGFAWDPQGNGKMSIRGGAGIYDQLPLLAFMGSTTNQTAPFLISGGNNNLAQGSFGGASTFSGPCPTAPSGSNPFQAGTSAACQVSASGGRVAYIDRAPKRAYVIQYNLSIEREIAPNTTLLIGYVGSHGVHGTTQVDDVNSVIPQNINSGWYYPCDNAITSVKFSGGNSNDCPGRGTGATINQSWGRLPATFFRNSSVYNGLQTQVTKQMSHGFQVTAGFTWQKSIDTGSGAVVSDSVITGISTLNWFDPKLSRAVSDFNDAKIFTLNYLWDVPTPKTQNGFTRSAIGGWELGGIFSASSGEPFTPLLAEGDVLGQNNTDRFAYPNRVNAPGCSGNAVNPGNVKDYVKLQCFVIPPVATINGVNYIQLGNVGRNSLTGPGLMDFDFSVVKNTKISRISDTFNVQLRLDIFNLFNRANFNPPVTNEFILDPTAVTPGAVAQPGPSGPCVANTTAVTTSGCTPSAGAFDGHDGTSTTSRQMQVSLKLVW